MADDPIVKMRLSQAEALGHAIQLLVENSSGEVREGFESALSVLSEMEFEE